MRARRRTWESRYTTRYRQWNHIRTQSMDNQQRTTNHIALPSRQASSLISNDIFNIDAPVNVSIRLNRMIYPHGRSWVDRRYGIGVGRPGLWFRDILWCWCGMVTEQCWWTWRQQAKSDGQKSFNMELWKDMACWRGLFFYRRAATIMRRLQYPPNYVVDVVKVIDCKKLKFRRADTHGKLRQNWCLLVEGPSYHEIMDLKWCHYAWTPC